MRCRFSHIETKTLHRLMWTSTRKDTYGLFVAHKGVGTGEGESQGLMKKNGQIGDDLRNLSGHRG